MSMNNLGRMIAPVLAAAAMTLSVSAVAASDPGKKACVAEAKHLCPNEMRSLSRKKVEACMIVKIEQTSPICHAAMLKIKTERETAIKR